MVVCKFFLQGNCRFGDKCKNEHPGDNTRASQPRNQNSNQNQNQNQNRFGALDDRVSGFGARGGRDNYESNRSRDPPARGGFQPRGGSQPRGGFQPRDNRNSSRNAQNAYGITRKTLEDDLHNERPQWIASSYGPGRDPPIQLFGGFPLEQSPEEIRVLHYLAVASGDIQQSAQIEAEVAAQSNLQVTNVLNDIDGAIQYIEAGRNEHPNRLDLLAEINRGQKHDLFSKANQRARRGVFKDQKTFKESQMTNGPFAISSNGFSPFNVNPPLSNALPNGGFPNNAQMNGFPVPGLAAPNRLQPFGMSAQIQGGFDSPAPFGLNHAPGPAPGQGFGDSTFNQQPGFPGQSQDMGNGIFGIPSQAPQPPFTQSSQQPSGVFARQPDPRQQEGVFQQPPQSQNNGIFGVSQPQEAAIQSQGHFLQPEITQPAQSSQPAVPNGVASQPQQQQIDTKIEDYTTRDPNTNKLLTFKNAPVLYIKEFPHYRRKDGSWERIWFADGPPPPPKVSELPDQSMYQDPNIQKAYEELRQTGQFQNGIVPDMPPRVEWVGWDI